MSWLTTFPLIESGLAVGAGVGVAVATGDGGAVGTGVAGFPVLIGGFGVAGAVVVIGIGGDIGGADPPPPLQPPRAAAMKIEIANWLTRVIESTRHGCRSDSRARRFQ